MNKAQTFKRTRLAPTPSGFLHLGNVLSFAITAALAKETGARILLRIDDLDRQRINKRYVQDIFDTLNYLEFPWDEGPRNYQEYEREYSQLHRLEIYRKALQRLKGQGQVFACDCSRTQIAANNPDGHYPGTCLHKKLFLDKENLNWRLQTESVGEITFKTWPASTISSCLPVSMQYFIVKKKDGHPSYQLTSLLDDLYFDVDFIVRGADLWPSTLGQYVLSGLLEEHSFQRNTFFHHSLLIGTAGQKLSKTTGSLSVQFLRKEGKTPEQIFALIGSMLGNKPPVTDWQTLAQAALITL